MIPKLLTLKKLIMNRHLLALGLTLSTALVSPMAFAAPVNLVQNGSFEIFTPGSAAKPSASQYTQNFGGISGWTLDRNGLELRNNVAGTAQNGSVFAELDVSANSKISQSISTIVGDSYTLGFYYSNRSYVSVASNGLGWSFGSLTGLAPELAYNGTSDNDWHFFQTTFMADSATSLLSFFATGTSDSYGSSLDNITLFHTSTARLVNNVPEPAGLALMLTGLLGMGWAGSRRRKQVQQ